MEGDNARQAGYNLTEKMKDVSMEQSECTIYKVHRHLRNVNPKAYEPEIIAIGPYHHGKDDLKMMEDHKLSYLSLLRQRKMENVDNYVLAIGHLESRARKSYAKPISPEMTETKFIEMLVLDGCFILELLRKHENQQWRQKNDPIFSMKWIFNSLQRDLLLFENQIPFFILCELYDLIEAPYQRDRLIDLLMNFFDSIHPEKEYKEHKYTIYSDDIKHVLDLIHRGWRPTSFDHLSYPSEKETKKQFIKRATGLREANVKFRIRNEKHRNLFELEFKNGTLLMPPLIVEDRTESLFRNLIVYEQYSPDSSNSINYMTDYVKLLDCLIDSSKDVEILCHKGIIENWLGDEEVVAKMVNQLVDSVAAPGDRFIYTQIFDKVNEHCSIRRNKWMAKLRTNHLNSPWAIISIIVAFVFLLIQITQTVLHIVGNKKSSN